MSNEGSNKHHNYYIPAYSKLPFFGALGLFCLLYGGVHLLHSNLLGLLIFFAGVVIVIAVLVGWFSEVIQEHGIGLYNDQVGRSFRWGMMWFIFSEICFFGIFFGALFYTRTISVPALAGYGANQNILTNIILWPNFHAVWPLFSNPNPQAFPGAAGTLHTWRIPAFNTLVLLSSAATLTWAHWSLKRNEQKKLIIGLITTIILGIMFLSLQAHEYLLAHSYYGLNLNSGIYGSTFFILTGFHALHVTIGLIILCAILIRILKGHFTPDDHFGFEASAWYWHFVDIVWLFLFIFVYWL